MIGRNADFTRRLRSWYQQHRRDLPWRLPLENSANLALNPYHVMVSEAMLQQTQVATVIPYFCRFIEQFPTLRALADADTEQVLRAWQGLGYYSRARNLQSAAKKILADFAGEVPASVEDLLTLPGIGPYTAGAISSIAFEKRAPILDGNVIRVLCRLDAITEDPRQPAVRDRLWKKATEILPRQQIGDFNSALMELGALVCTPRAPQCLICPVQANCLATARGLQDQIPPAKPTRQIPLHRRWTFCIGRDNRYLVQKRPDTGRWAGMWQFPTTETPTTAATADFVQRQFAVQTTEPIHFALVEQTLTHRKYRFDVFTCEIKSLAPPKPRAGRQLQRSPTPTIPETPTAFSSAAWLTLDEMNTLPLPRPHLKIRDFLLARVHQTKNGQPGI